MGFFARTGDVAGHLSGVLCALADEGENRRRCVTRLFLHDREVQRPAVQPRWRPGLQPRHPEGHFPQPFRKPYRGRIAGAAARSLGVSDQDAATEKRADGENDRGGGKRFAPCGYGAGNTITLDDEVHNICFGDRQTGLGLEQRPDRAPVEFPVRLGTGGAHRGALARVQCPKLDPGPVDGGCHDPSERIDLACQVPLADATDRRVTAHLSQRRTLLRDEQRAGILAAFLYMRKRRRQDSAALTKVSMPMLRGKHSLLIAVCVLGLMPALAPSALELEDCRISAGPAFPGINARCGTMLRPENPDDDGSPEIEIAVAVVPALDLKPEPDPFVPLAGGPGASAIEFYAAYSGAFEHVRRHRDILLVDQRGTGSSSRMDCAVDVDIIEGAYSEERVVDVTRDCLDALPHDPRFFTTSVAVTDLEALREALGYGPLNLYGVSYGSRVAQHFAKRFPDATRSIVLDGVVAPQIVLGPEIATEAQSALDAIFARCAADETCDARFRDLPQKFRQIRAELEEQPVTVDIPNPVTGDPEITEFGSAELAGAIRLLAYNALPVATSDRSRRSFR
jgi:pimeloyl-ACP methyl ester carboxylesterase